MSIKWTPPDPDQLPEWRSQMLDYFDRPSTVDIINQALLAGQATLVPEVVPAPGVRQGSIGAQRLARSEQGISARLLIQAERDRLAQGELYYATPDMTALAVAAGQTPPTEPVSLSRLPSPGGGADRAGMILFSEPIGGYVQDAAAALAGSIAYRPGASAMTTTPIVAVSWSQWYPGAASAAHGGPVRWMYRAGGRKTLIPANYSGVWLTFYSPSGLFSGLAPDHIVGNMADGSLMTAGQIDARRNAGGPPLGWDNEMLLTTGAPFGPAKPDTNESWAQTLYTAWQLITQKGKTRWAEMEEIPRNRKGSKRDARQGITGSGAVRIAHVHPTRRPPARAAQEDAEASTGRREPQYSCRWPVRPYHRNACLNPPVHADGGCEHEDRIVPGHIKGPPGAPFRVSERVNLWDSQPAPE